MKNKRTPLLVKISMVATNSPRKTQSQLVKDAFDVKKKKINAESASQAKKYYLVTLSPSKNRDFVKLLEILLKAQEAINKHEDATVGIEELAASKGVHVYRKLRQLVQQKTQNEDESSNATKEKQAGDVLILYNNKKQKTLFRDKSFGSIDTSSTFSPPDSQASTVEELDEKEEVMYLWKRPFIELGDRNLEEMDSLHEPSDWFTLYKHACFKAEQNTLFPLDKIERLVFSGIFNDDNANLKHLRLDLLENIEKNIKLLKRSIIDNQIYLPTAHTTMDELVLNNILANNIHYKKKTLIFPKNPSLNLNPV